MGQRLAIGLGAAAVIAGAVGILAPQAAAQELARGVSCDGFNCRNDTGDTYRIKGTAKCSDGAWVPVTKYVAPHVQSTRVNVDCAPTIIERGGWKQQPQRMTPGTWENQPPKIGKDGKPEPQPPVYKPGHWENQPDVYVPERSTPNWPVSIEYREAVIDNSPPPLATGSFGR